MLVNPLKDNDLKAFLSLTLYLHLFPNYTSTLIMEDNKYLTEKQASHYFQISERTLGNYRREGRFEVSKVFIYVGKQVRYNLKELISYFEHSSALTN